MGGKKAAAKVAINDLLNELGFPAGFIVKRLKKTLQGDEYSVSYLSDGVKKAAKVVYQEINGAQLLEDHRSEWLSPDRAPDSERKKRTAALPDVFMRVRSILMDQLVGVSYVASSPSWLKEVPIDAEIIVVDKTGNRHVVYCVFVRTRDDREKLLRTLSDTQRTHTSIIAWPPNTSIKTISGGIISDIRGWQQFRWSHKKV
jgi:hypothetical protein